MKITDIFFAPDIIENIFLAFFYLAGIFFLGISIYALILMF